MAQRARRLPKPPLQVYFEGLAKVCAAAAEQIDAIAATHRAEEGRLFEEVLRQLLARFLPRKYSVGTGFMFNHDNAFSNQTDIVIYDSHSNSQVFGEYSSVFFPIECVYACLEVKKTLYVRQLDKALADVQRIRKVAKMKQYVEYSGEKSPTGRGWIAKRNAKKSFIAPRTFIFAYSARASIKTILNRLNAGWNKHGGHIHGLYVLDRKLLITQRDYENDNPFDVTENAKLADFCRWLLEGLDCMRLGLVDLEPYFGGPVRKG